MDIRAGKCLIIDDDPTISDLIKYYCSKVNFISHCEVCNNAIDGLKMLSTQKFDLLFLDFNLPDLNGDAILDLKKDDSKVIMVTSNPEFAIESYTYQQVIDYLLKPVTFERFYKAIEKYNQISESSYQLNSEIDEYFIKDGTKYVKVKLKDLLFIKSESNYVHWQTINQKILSLMNLKELDENLPSNFLRVHRSYIVNKNYIDIIHKDEITIHDYNIPIGAKYKSVISEILGIN